MTKDVPDNSVVAGVPARVICTTEEYLENTRTVRIILADGLMSRKERIMKINTGMPGKILKLSVSRRNADYISGKTAQSFP